MYQNKTFNLIYLVLKNLRMNGDGSQYTTMFQIECAFPLNACLEDGFWRKELKEEIV